MSLASLKMDDNVVIKEEIDYVSNGKSVLESDLYNGTVSMAYTGESSGGALTLTLHIDTVDNGEYKETFFLTTRLDKGRNTIIKDKNGESRYIGGYATINNLCLLTLNKELKTMVEEPKVIKLWNWTTKSEEPTTVPVLVELIGQPVTSGIQKINETKDKNTAPQGAPPKWENTGETRDVNKIDKLFRAADGLTVAEIKAGATQESYKSTWLSNNKGVTQMRAKPVPGGQTQAASVLSTASAIDKPVKSIFGN